MSDATDIERLKLVVQPLVDWYWSVKPTFAQQFPGSSLTVAVGFRTLQMQQDAHASGESKANGLTSFSKHQLYPSQAIDVMVIENDATVGNGADRRYTWLQDEARQSGLFPGVDFKTAKPDFDHFETMGPQPNATAIAAATTAYEKTQEA